MKQNSGRRSIGNGVVVCLLRNLLSKHQGRRWKIRSSSKQVRGKRINASMRINDYERKEDCAVVVVACSLRRQPQAAIKMNVHY
jgi:hypothetical protein